jgi:predicted site-specific integrase-resolvase
VTGPGRKLGEPLPLHVVAQRLGVSVFTARRYVHLRRFPNAYKLDGAWRVPEHDVEQFRCSRLLAPA